MDVSSSAGTNPAQGDVGLNEAAGAVAKSFFELPALNAVCINAAISPGRAKMVEGDEEEEDCEVLT